MQKEQRTLAFRLCISIFAQSMALLSEKIKRARDFEPDLLELRLDSMKDLNEKKLESVRKLLLGNECLTIRTHSEGGESMMPDEKRVSLTRASVISLKPQFIDVEISTLAKYPQILLDIEKSKTKLIASFHDLEGKKNLSGLKKVVSQAPLRSKSLYAIKIVSQANKISDNRKILSLYSSKILKGKEAPKLVAFCTGDKGIVSRIRCLFAGSPFSYCSLPGEPVAPGQLDIDKMRQLIAKKIFQA